MLEISSPIGNIFVDEEFKDLKIKEFETLKLSRLDLEKRILRRNTNQGTDVALNLTPGIKLRNGDIFAKGNTTILVEQLPEKVISVKLKTQNNFKVLILLGHIIGNRHRPVFIQDDEILFPIQADSEIGVFTSLFQGIKEHIEISIKEQVFYPLQNTDVHEH